MIFNFFIWLYILFIRMLNSYLKFAYIVFYHVIFSVVAFLMSLLCMNLKKYMFIFYSFPRNIILLHNNRFNSSIPYCIVYKSRESILKLPYFIRRAFLLMRLFTTRFDTYVGLSSSGIHFYKDL